ncbi:MAG: elongation factor P [Pseudomonadota bacterium]
MKVNANTLSKGNVIEHDGKLMQVLSTFISKPGKGGAFIQLELRDIRTGNKDNIRQRTQETVERVVLDQQDFQYLYNDGEVFTFMNTESYEQVEIKKELIGDAAPYLQDGMMVTVEMYEGEALSIKLPDTITVEIVEAEPVVKGQTASSSYKPAMSDIGVRVMVPPHIDTGTKVIIKTEDGTYVERAKD